MDENQNLQDEEYSKQSLKQYWRWRMSNEGGMLPNPIPYIHKTSCFPKLIRQSVWLSKWIEFYFSPFF